MAGNADVELKFTTELFRQREQNKTYCLIPKSEYNKIVEDVKTAAVNNATKSRQEYYNLAKYDVLQCGPVEKLIKKRSCAEQTPVYYVTIEETFDVIKRAHISTGHGGRDRMIKETQRKYANISTKSLELFKSLCEECQKKRKRPMTKGVVVRPIISKEFASRGQVDLVDMQSMPSNGYKWIMVYQDHLTKFCVLRPIRSKRAVEVAAQLLDIFLVIGAPAILQSDNGTEFTANIISELKDFWPTLVLVHGKPRHPQSQGSVERANGDIKDMLVAWLADNHTQDWATGIKFVQFYKNSSHHSGIKRSPYSALFGSEASVGLTTSSLPFEVLKNLETEEDLLALVLHQPSSESSDPSPTESNPQTHSESNPPAPSESNPQASSESNPPAPSESNSQWIVAEEIQEIYLV
ncbi:KRAB-A domain-containing protein 2-like [Littorina saxatilis]|uniref:KRAB-A domain-containing protein 2-like n=1 Tax=Littorina saxatilis TaxID=31220 RepID=UPI0038B41D0B